MLDSDYKLHIPVGKRDHAAGPANAPITLVEYADYQCPYCGQAYPIVKRIQQDLENNLRFVFRNFPLTQMHEFAFGAAEASEIAGEYDRFWMMHDLLFEHQYALDLPYLVEYAKMAGINEVEFENKLINNDKAQKVQDDFMGGVESGVNGTPSFYINGTKYEGPWDYDSMREVLIRML